MDGIAYWWYDNCTSGIDPSTSSPPNSPVLSQDTHSSGWLAQLDQCRLLGMIQYSFISLCFCYFFEMDLDSCLVLTQTARLSPSTDSAIFILLAHTSTAARGMKVFV